MRLVSTLLPFLEPSSSGCSKQKQAPTAKPRTLPLESNYGEGGRVSNEPRWCYRNLEKHLTWPSESMETLVIKLRKQHWTNQALWKLLWVRRPRQSMGPLTVKPVFNTRAKWTLGSHSLWRDTIAAQIRQGAPIPSPQWYDRLWRSLVEGFTIPGEDFGNG